MKKILRRRKKNKPIILYSVNINKCVYLFEIIDLKQEICLQSKLAIAESKGIFIIKGKNEKKKLNTLELGEIPDI